MNETVDPALPALQQNQSATAAAEHPHSISTDCRNCGTELQGAYCHACGQRGSSASVGVHDFVHEAAHEFLHVDGKILQTIRLLVWKPGQLTVEFLEGRRARYISPLRVYLTFSLLFFTLAALLPRGLDGAVKVRGPKGAGQLHAETDFERRLQSGLSKAEKDGTLVAKEVLHDLPKVMFVLMPVFALLTWAFYRRQQKYYVPHLYYAVHFHAFMFLVMSVYVLIQRLGVPRPFVAPIILVNVPYHFIALRRVYGGSRGRTLAKGFAIGFLYWLVAATALIALGFWILLHL